MHFACTRDAKPALLQRKNNKSHSHQRIIQHRYIAADIPSLKSILTQGTKKEEI